MALPLNEDVVRAILDNPPDRSHRSVAQDHGLTAFTVQRVRTGKRYAHIAPEFPRHPAEVFTRTCLTCKHREGKGCALGVPEGAVTTLFAPMCSAYTAIPEAEEDQLPL
jgi:hypothetical protein